MALVKANCLTCKHLLRDLNGEKHTDFCRRLCDKETGTKIRRIDPDAPPECNGVAFEPWDLDLETPRSPGERLEEALVDLSQSIDDLAVLVGGDLLQAVREIGAEPEPAGAEPRLTEPEIRALLWAWDFIVEGGARRYTKTEYLDKALKAIK